MKIKSDKRILIWGNDYNSVFVFNELRKIYPHLSIVDIDKPFLTKLKHILKNDIKYVISGKMGILIVISRLLGKRIIMHWVGTDLVAYKKSAPLKKFLYKIIPTKHIFVTSELRDEFSKSIKAHIFPILKKPPFIKTDFKIHKEILTYIPQNREDFYYGDFITHYFKNNKDYNLNVIGNNGINLAESTNIKYHGWVDEKTVQELINKCSIYIRFLKHDGFPKLVIDNLYNFNFVIYNHKFPHTIYCQPTSSQLNTVLSNIYSRHSLKIANKKHHKYAEMLYEKYNIAKLAEAIIEK